MKKKILLGSLSLFALTSISQTTVELVKDINPSGESSPYNFAEYDGSLFFRADNGTDGRELFISDGTSLGTEMLKDINPSGHSSPGSFVAYDGKLLFSADDGNGSELWITDGSSLGTQFLKDINPASGGDSDIIHFTEYNDMLLFRADDGTNGNELWITDGTSSGTQLLKDINPSGDSYCLGFSAQYNGKLFFNADDGINGYELWVTDGTVSGTQMFKDINPSGDASPKHFVESNGKLFFRADDGVNGIELWSTDGTVGGTQMVKDINPTGLSGPSYITEFNGKIFFEADDGANGSELWMSDGTAAGTQMLKDINTAGESYPFYFTEFNGKLFFAATDDDNGRELWGTDGTTGGTQMIKDIDPGSLNSDPWSGDPKNLTIFNNHLYFVAYKNGLRELYQSDGTNNGTFVIEPSDASSIDPCDDTYQLFEATNALYLSAKFHDLGDELYRVTDGEVSVDTQPELVAFQVYPNPVSDQLIIKTEEKSNFTLLDIKGKVLRSFNVNNLKEVSVTNLAAGIYFLRENITGAQLKVVKR